VPPARVWQEHATADRDIRWLKASLMARLACGTAVRELLERRDDAAASASI
jgi:hypothetical protein